MNEEQLKLSLTMYDRTYTFEQDEDNCQNLIEGFIGLCLAQTYHKETVINCLKKYIDENDF